MSWARLTYGEHRRSARRRRIAFEITFEEWLTWWQRELGPDWQFLRGTSRNQFHMARINDRGPYKIGNIKCITSAENIKEVWADGRMQAAMEAPERRAKLSAAFRGRKFSPEHRAKLSAALKGHKNNVGRKLSPEHRAKISAAMAGNKNASGRTTQ
jgi:NUMOD3 motif